MNWLGLIILGLVLLMVAYYLGRADAPPLPPIVRWFCGLVGAICLAVGLILFVFALAGAASPRLGLIDVSGLAAGVLFLGVVNPSDQNSAGGYVWKYVLNAVLVVGSFVSAIGTFVTMNPQANAAWLGLSDVQWHWALLVIGVVTIAYNGLTHAPPLTAPPTKARLQVERVVQTLRSAR